MDKDYKIDSIGLKILVICIIFYLVTQYLGHKEEKTNNTIVGQGIILVKNIDTDLIGTITEEPQYITENLAILRIEIGKKDADGNKIKTFAIVANHYDNNDKRLFIGQKIKVQQYSISEPYAPETHLRIAVK